MMKVTFYVVLEPLFNMAGQVTGTKISQQNYRTAPNSIPQHAIPVRIEIEIDPEVFRPVTLQGSIKSEPEVQRASRVDITQVKRIRKAP